MLDLVLGEVVRHFSACKIQRDRQDWVPAVFEKVSLVFGCVSSSPFFLSCQITLKETKTLSRHRKWNHTGSLHTNPSPQALAVKGKGLFFVLFFRYKLSKKNMQNREFLFLRLAVASTISDFHFSSKEASRPWLSGNLIRSQDSEIHTMTAVISPRSGSSIYQVYMWNPKGNHSMQLEI